MLMSWIECLLEESKNVPSLPSPYTQTRRLLKFKVIPETEVAIGENKIVVFL
jgi:hypothetical protein